MTKTLYILRHAKAETGTPTQEDHTRALTERGIVAAQQMGARLFRQGIIPDLVLCSTAVRTRQTWQYVGLAYTPAPPVQYLERGYQASANEWLSLVAEVEDSVRSLLIIGHNPGLHQLCLKLAVQGDEPRLDAVSLKFPTCAFAAIELGEVSWRDASRARGTLTYFTTPSEE